MAALYLHIGTPKTGTSAIQRFLPLNNELLQEQGFCYPDLGYRFPGIGKNRNAHFLVYRQSCKLKSEEETTQIRRLEDEQFCEGLDKIKELTETYPNVILSDENIWNGYWKRDNFWYVLKDELSKRGIDLKVIVYLRRQDLLIESYWSQQVKETSQVSFNEYLESEMYSYFKLDYYAQLTHIANVVGKENIIVRAYEKNQYEGNGNTLISDFLKVLGLELNTRYEHADIIANTSLYGKYLEIKRILNGIDCFCTKMNWAVKYLRAIQEEEESNIGLSECQYFTYAQQIVFLNKYKDGNEAVAKEFMNREDGKLFYDEIKKRNDDEKSYSSEELVLICGRMLELQHEDLNNKLESEREDSKNKIAALKNSLAWAKRPLYRKIGGKIFHLFK